MQIIKQGVIPKWEKECHHCETQFSWDRRDLKYDAVGIFITGYVVCPICESKIDAEIRHSRFN